MKQRILSVLLALALMICVLPAAKAEGVEIAAPSAILMDAATGTILYEKNAHERLAPASVTKVMTLLLVMEALDSGRITWDDMVTASETAAGKGGSQVYLEVGEQMSMDEMLKSVVVSSANDCATALAEHVAGSEAAFVERMNARAAELGLEDTHFVNCTGLDDEPNAAEHLTSAYDIAVMSRELLKHDEIREYTTIWMDSVRDGQFGLSNTNKLVRFYQGTTGLKTGFTSGAGYCLSATAEREGMELIAVVLGSPTSADRFETAKALLNYGFAASSLVTAAPSEPLPEIPVNLGKAASVQPVLEKESQLLLAKGDAAKVTTTVDLPDSVQAPVTQGQELGALTVLVDGQEKARLPLVAQEEVPRLSLPEVYQGLLRILFCLV